MSLHLDTPPPSTDASAEVLEIVRTLAVELQPQRRMESVNLDSSLERDLGLDSLGRVELLARLERRFGARLPESILASAETPRDLLNALAVATPGAGFSFVPGGVETADPRDAAEQLPDRARTLMEALAWHADRHPERRHVLHYPGDGEPEELTYGELQRRARATAAGLLELGLAPGGTVGLMLPTSLDYFVAFFGALLAGGVPVPLYPPVRRSQIEDHLRRQAGILRTAEAEVLISFSEVLPLARLLRGQVPSLKKVTTVDDLRSRGEGVALLPIPRKTEDVAFLQFTSGSTGNPKGVVLTHANLLANLRAIGQGAEIRPGDSVVSWLPLYHDMGLIGAWMGSLYFSMPLALMSPLSFLARPSRWLWTIHHHRATLSAAPNFAYELCVQKIEDAEIAGLDLSSWRFALNGAEPVSPEVIRRFTERFAPYGFRPGALAPVYGLAENSLAVAFPPVGRPPKVDAVQRDAFQRSGQALPAASEEDPHALRFVSCGFPLPDHEVRVVDPAGLELGERREGRLELRGPSATSGYYRNSEATRKLFHGEWLDTGDLAYVAEGEVYITGRVKDIIVRAGRNLYPQELEGAVGELPGVRKGCVAVFGSPDPATGTERLVVLAETRETGRQGEAERERLRAAIQAVAVDLLGAPADDVVLAPPHTVPKTSSGKIRRGASREVYESGRIGRRGPALGWQIARLAAAGARAQAGRSWRAAAGFLYAFWFGLVFALAAPPVWVAVMVLPGRRRRRAFAGAVGRTLARLLGIPLQVDGLEHLEGRHPCLIAANHASYLDGFVLTAVLPPDFGYVVKSELERRFIPRLLLRRLGTVFVERFDATQSQSEARKVLESLEGGDSLAIFPEGTFRRAPGLRPFRLGAFTVAAEAGAPVVPVAIRGTRSVLRGGGFFPRRGSVTVSVAPPVVPEGDGWKDAVRLRDTVRAEILARCGEPDLIS